MDAAGPSWREIPPPDSSAAGLGNVLLSRDGRVGVWGYFVNTTELCLVRGLR